MAEIKIEDGTGKVKRNIHFWVIGIFCVVAFTTLYVQQTRKKPIDPLQQEKTEEAKRIAGESKPKADQLTQKLKDQEASADKKKEALSAGKPADLSIPVPSVVGEGMAINSNGYASKQDQGLADEEVERKKREAMISGSSILAIDDSKSFDIAKAAALQNNRQQTVDAQPQYLANTQTDPSSADLIKVLAAANQPAQPAQPLIAPNTAVALDRQWATQASTNVKKPEVIIEDTPNSPYTIFQGFIIPCELYSLVNSDLPGNIIGRTTQNVYDGVTSTHLIIPAGSLVYGIYNNDINVGQGKIMSAFQRIVMPNGRSITLPGLSAADAFGQTGITGDVNNHFFQMYTGSVLVAALGAVVDSSKNNNTNVATGTGYPSTASQVTSASGQVLVDLSRSILQRNNNIRPTITLKQGDKFNIMVQRDFAVSPAK